MADSMVAGLFGLTPEMYQNQQYQQDLKRGYELAQLSPGAAAQAGLQASVGQLGRGVAGLMGVEDPQMKIISARQQIIGRLDQTNPTSMLEGAKMLAQMGDQQGAFALADYARKAQSEIAQAQQRLAAAGRERQQAVPPAVLTAQTVADLKIGISRLEALPESPERNETLDRLRFNLEELQRQAGGKQPEFLAKAAEVQGLKANLRVLKSQPEPNKEAIQRIEDSIQSIEGPPKEGKTPTKIGVAKGSDQVVFYDPNKDEQFVLSIGTDGKQVRKPYTGGVDTTTSKTTIPLGDVLQKVFQSKEVEDAAKAFGQAGDAYTITVPLIKKLETVESTVNNAFTGAASNINLNISKGLSALGVKVSDRATDTEIADAISAQVVQQIAKVFPGSQSNKELDQLLKSKFNLKQELPTILRLVGQIKDEMLAQTKTYEQMANLPANERTNFNAKLAQGKNYQKIQKYRDYEKKYLNKTITPEERAEAAKLKQELSL